MQSIRTWLILSLLFLTIKLHSYQYDLSVCTIFRDDARFLKEWIEYHKLVGVQHFYLFDNLSEDDFQNVLEPFINAGDVTLIPWPLASNDLYSWNRVQCLSIEKGIELAAGISKWLAIIDTDEFMVPVGYRNLHDLLKEYEEFGGLGVNWMTFGTSHVERIPDNRLMIETLLLRAKDGDPSHHMIKSIIQPDKVLFPVDSPHYFRFKEGFWCVDSNFDFISRAQTKTYQFDKVRLHHYRFRDKDFFYNVKIARQSKYICADLAIQLEASCNEVYDDTMLQFVPCLLK